MRGKSWNILGLFIVWIWKTVVPRHQTWKHYYYECLKIWWGILVTINCGQIWDLLMDITKADFNRSNIQTQVSPSTYQVSSRYRILKYSVSIYSEKKLLYYQVLDKTLLSVGIFSWRVGFQKTIKMIVWNALITNIQRVPAFERVSCFLQSVHMSFLWLIK